MRDLIQSVTDNQLDALDWNYTALIRTTELISGKIVREPALKFYINSTSLHLVPEEQLELDW